MTRLTRAQRKQKKERDAVANRRDGESEDDDLPPLAPNPNHTERSSRQSRKPPIAIAVNKPKASVSRDGNSTGGESDRIDNIDTFTGVYIRNLHPEEREGDLRVLFERFGAIHSVNVAKPRPGSESTVGWVNYKDHSSAVAAIDGLHNKYRNSSAGNMLVSRDRPKKDRAERSETVEDKNLSRNKLFVRGITADATEQQLRNIFEPFGALRGVSFEGSYTLTGRTWYAFVHYEDHHSAAAAMKALNRRLVETPVGTLDIQFARRSPQHQEPRETNTLWFENFDPRTTDTDIMKFFETFGTVVSCQGRIDNSDRGGRCGFVCFQTASQANKALEGMQLQDTQVRVKLWTRPKDFELVEKVPPPKEGKGVKASRNLDAQVDEEDREIFADTDLSTARLRRAGPSATKSSNVLIVENAPAEERADLMRTILLKQISSKRPALAGRIVEELMCMPTRKVVALLDSPRELSVAVEEIVESFLEEE